MQDEKQQEHGLGRVQPGWGTEGELGGGLAVQPGRGQQGLQLLQPPERRSLGPGNLRGRGGLQLRGRGARQPGGGLAQQHREREQGLRLLWSAKLWCQGRQVKEKDYYISGDPT